MAFPFRSEMSSSKVFDRATQRFVSKTRWVRSRPLGGFSGGIDPEFDDDAMFLGRVAEITSRGEFISFDGSVFDSEFTAPHIPQLNTKSTKRLTMVEIEQAEYEEARRKKRAAEDKRIADEWNRIEREKRAERDAEIAEGRRLEAIEQARHAKEAARVADVVRAVRARQSAPLVPPPPSEEAALLLPIVSVERCRELADEVHRKGGDEELHKFRAEADRLSKCHGLHPITVENLKACGLI